MCWGTTRWLGQGDVLLKWNWMSCPDDMMWQQPEQGLTALVVHLFVHKLLLETRGARKSWWFCQLLGPTFCFSRLHWAVDAVVSTHHPLQFLLFQGQLNGKQPNKVITWSRVHFVQLASYKITSTATPALSHTHQHPSFIVNQLLSVWCSSALPTPIGVCGLP